MHQLMLVELRGIEITRFAGQNVIEPILVEEALERAMKPFFSDCPNPLTVEDQREYSEDDGEVRPLCTEHKAHEWDWYVIGGRYVDFFQSVPSPTALPLQGIDAARSYNDFARRIPGSRLEEEPVREGFDVILKRDVDWEAMAARKMQRLNEAWSKHEAEPDQNAYWTYGIEAEDTSREAFIQRRMKDRTYGIVTASGEWVERETFIYVPSDAGKSRFEETPEWDRLWDRMVASMPDDAVLAAVDCHN